MEQMKQYSFFTNRACDFFPCHKDADLEDFNCLFCFCPLYVLGDRCGGNFVYQTNGQKDCTRCTFPHRRDNYEAIIQRHEEIIAVMAVPVNSVTECNCKDVE